MVHVTGILQLFDVVAYVDPVSTTIRFIRFDATQNNTRLVSTYSNLHRIDMVHDQGISQNEDLQMLTSE